MAFSVLVVCTGNICRSPAAELLLRARFTALAADLDGVDVRVASAGTGGLTGHGLDAPTALALHDLGIATDAHVAQRLRPDYVTGADLVLTAGTDHRSTVVQGEPLAFRKTFTLREFARLGAELPLLEPPVTEQALRARVGEVAAQRGWVEPGPPGSDEIADPFGAGVDVARSTVAVVAATVDEIVRALGLGRSGN